MQENIYQLFSYVLEILKLNLYMHTIFISLQKIYSWKNDLKNRYITSPHFIIKLNLFLYFISFLMANISVYIFRNIFLINQNICYISFQANSCPVCYDFL